MPDPVSLTENFTLLIDFITVTFILIDFGLSAKLRNDCHSKLLS